MAALTDPSTCSYTTAAGTIIFPVETETLDVQITPIPDAAKRTIRANQYLIKLKSWVIRTAGGISDTNSTMDSIRNILTQQGGAFRYESKGLGTINLNVAGGHKDVAWGPIPKLLSWKPVAGQYACEFVWVVEFQTLDCSAARFQFGVMEFAYKVDYEYPRDRMGRRQITGHLRIPQTRAFPGARFLTDNADKYREQVATPVPIGFRRENERYTISEDKCRLDFGWTDVVLKAPLPPGMTDFDFTHTQNTAKPIVAIAWNGSLSARYEVAPGWPLVGAWAHFGQIVKDRLGAMWVAGFAGGVGAGGVGDLKSFAIPQHWTMSEDPQTRECRYSLSYFRITNLVEASNGMYREIPGNNHAVWAASLRQLGATMPRGYANDRLLDSDDLIIDLCGQNYVSQGGPLFQPPRFVVSTPWEIVIPCPPPGSSWYHFENHLVISFDDHTVQHQPLPPAANKAPQPSLGDADPNGPNPFAMPPPSSPEPSNRSIVQKRAKRRVHVWMFGRAIRICYEIPAPGLVSIAGVPAIPANRMGQEYFSMVTLGNFGEPIYGASWCLRWILTDIPQGPIRPPVNPQAPTTNIPLGSGNLQGKT